MNQLQFYPKHHALNLCLVLLHRVRSKLKINEWYLLSHIQYLLGPLYNCLQGHYSISCFASIFQECIPWRGNIPSLHHCAERNLNTGITYQIVLIGIIKTLNHSISQRIGNCLHATLNNVQKVFYKVWKVKPGHSESVFNMSYNWFLYWLNISS